jgi:hypothetical protein
MAHPVTGCPLNGRSLNRLRIHGSCLTWRGKQLAGQENDAQDAKKSRGKLTFEHASAPSPIVYVLQNNNRTGVL